MKVIVIGGGPGGYEAAIKAVMGQQKYYRPKAYLRRYCPMYV